MRGGDDLEENTQHSMLLIAGSACGDDDGLKPHLPGSMDTATEHSPEPESTPSEGESGQPTEPFRPEDSSAEIEKLEVLCVAHGETVTHTVASSLRQASF